MKRSTVKIFAAFVLAMLLASSGKAASHAEDLFQQAMVKETGERDPEAALKLYEQVIEEAGSNHRLMAKARLHMGNCLEKLGKPKEAEEIYLEIVQDSAASLTEAAQAAQANLEHLKALEKKVQEEDARVQAAAKSVRPMVLVREFQETKFSLVGGPSVDRTGSHSLEDVSLNLRYRVSSSSKPLSVFGEIGGLIPVHGTDIQEGLKLHEQIHLAFIAELPHGDQKKTIPELGVGAAVTSARDKTWGPYLTAGVKFFADKRVSLLIAGHYSANPYTTNTQALGLPTSIWSATAQICIKIGSTKTLMRPKL